MSHVMRKPVFEVCDQVRLNRPAQLVRLDRVLKFAHDVAHVALQHNKAKLKNKWLCLLYNQVPEICEMT